MADETLSDRDRMLIAFHTHDLIRKTYGRSGVETQVILATEYANIAAGDPPTLKRIAEMVEFSETSKPLPMGVEE